MLLLLADRRALALVLETDEANGELSGAALDQASARVRKRFQLV